MRFSPIGAIMVALVVATVVLAIVAPAVSLLTFGILLFVLVLAIGPPRWTRDRKVDDAWIGRG